VVEIVKGFLHVVFHPADGQPGPLCDLLVCELFLSGEPENLSRSGWQFRQGLLISPHQVGCLHYPLLFGVNRDFKGFLDGDMDGKVTRRVPFGSPIEKVACNRTEVGLRRAQRRDRRCSDEIGEGLLNEIVNFIVVADGSPKEADQTRSFRAEQSVNEPIVRRGLQARALVVVCGAHREGRRIRR